MKNETMVVGLVLTVFMSGTAIAKLKSSPYIQ
jgi:hypothetical protein